MANRSLYHVFVLFAAGAIFSITSCAIHAALLPAGPGQNDSKENIALLIEDQSGQPASHAEVVVSTLERPIKFTSASPAPSALFTDQSGKILIPKTTGLATIAIRHDSGYAEIDADQIPNAKSIRLQPWATVRGIAVRGNQTLSRAKITMTRSDADAIRSQPRIQHELRAQADRTGHFIFDRVPPLRFGVVRNYERGETIPEWIEPKPGKTLDITLGVAVRSVAGNILFPPDFGILPSWEGDPQFGQDATLQLETEIKRPRIPPELASAWMRNIIDRAWLATEQGMIWETSQHPITCLLDSDGGFTIEGVQPGNYRLRAILYDIDPITRKAEPLVRADVPIRVFPAADAQEADVPIKLRPIQSKRAK